MTPPRFISEPVPVCPHRRILRNSSDVHLARFVFTDKSEAVSPNMWTAYDVRCRRMGL